jgi:hypothetical protein
VALLFIGPRPLLKVNVRVSNAGLWLHLALPSAHLTVRAFRRKVLDIPGTTRTYNACRHDRRARQEQTGVLAPALFGILDLPESQSALRSR